jgi:hypothetical protein
LAFRQGRKSSAFYRADVNENVVAAVIWSDKSKPLLTIKPLHSTRCHTISSFAAAGSSARYPRDDRDFLLTLPKLNVMSARGLNHTRADFLAEKIMARDDFAVGA